MATSAALDEYTTAQAAEILGVSATTIRRYEGMGMLTARRTLGRQRRFSVAEVERVRKLTHPEPCTLCEPQA